MKRLAYPTLTLALVGVLALGAGVPGAAVASGPVVAAKARAKKVHALLRKRGIAFPQSCSPGH